MATKTRLNQKDLLYAPKDGACYIVILHDGCKVKAQWNAAASFFYRDGDQSVRILRKEAFDWWPTSV